MNKSEAVIIRFWGTRGSIPTPGVNTVLYGGNTTCIEIKSPSSLIVLDGGTGIKALGNEIINHYNEKNIKLFITHPHWDHIQGMPFFSPLYDPRYHIEIYGPKTNDKSIKELLGIQMNSLFFPVRQNELLADIKYYDVKEGDELSFLDFSVLSKFVNHPVITLGYCLKFKSGKICFTGDHEPYENFFHNEDTQIIKIKEIMTQKLLKFIEGSDFLIMEAQFNEDDYGRKAGWGHCSYYKAIEIAYKAGVKNLIITHYDPNYTDDYLMNIETQLKTYIHDNLNGSLSLQFAREGNAVIL